MKNRMQSLFETIKGKETLLFTIAFLILISFRVWLIIGIPNLLINAPHDDLYFAKAAHFIVHGQWMGPYNQMTLIKTPFYAFFMIFSFFTGLPLFLNETIFFLTACIFLFYSFSPLIKNRWWRLGLFLIVLYAPASLATYMNIRVYREFVYFSLTLYVVASSIGLFLRLDKDISTILLWSVGLGTSMGAFMITREEGVWIYPILSLLLSTCLLVIWRGKTNQKIKRSLLIFLPVFIWYIPIFAVSSLNYTYYGYWGTTEQLDPNFNRVLNTLARIKASDAWHPAVQVPKEARMKAYEASPLLNSLRDSVENSVPAWNYWEDQALLIKPSWYTAKYLGDGSEISNGHFVWLLRDVAYSEGYYSSGKYPYEFYKQIADELEIACNNGELECSSPKRIPFIGSIDKRHYPIILRMFMDNISHLLNQDYIDIVSLDVNSWAPWPQSSENYKYFEEFIYNSVDVPGLHSESNTQLLVAGKIDLRLKVLIYKEKIIRFVFKIYKGFTLPVFLISFALWILSIFSFIFKKQSGSSRFNYPVISLFTLGLFLSRLMTLTIVDATTSAAGIIYSASNYLFLYIFLLVVLYCVFEQHILPFFKKKIDQ